MKNKKVVNKADLIKEISHETNISREAVSEVINSLINISIEQLVNGAKISLPSLISIETIEVNGGVTPTGKELLTYNRLRASISPTLKMLFKFQNNELKDKPYAINRDSWKNAKEWIQQEIEVETKDSVGNNVVDNYNPFIDEED